MANQTISAKLLNVCKTTEQWAAEETVLSKGLLCVEFTTDGNTRVKIGDGLNKYSDLEYLEGDKVDLSEYSTTEEVTEMIDTKVASLGTILKFKGVVATVDELPTENNTAGDIWFVGAVPETPESTEAVDYFTEYVWTTDNKFEFIGRINTEVDLSSYATKTYVDTAVGGLDERVTALEEKTTPIATTEKVGGVKVGEGLAVAEDGTLSVDIPDATSEKSGLMSAEDKATVAAVSEVDLTKIVSSDDTLVINCTL